MTDDETLAEHIYHLSCYLAQEAEWFRDNDMEGWFHHLSRDAEYLRMRADRESIQWQISSSGTADTASPETATQTPTG